MRKGLIMIVLVSLAGMAFAADKPAEGKPPIAAKAAPSPAQPSTATAAAEVAKPAPAEVAEPAAKPKVKARKRLPRGDMRHCLELKDNAAIIKCSEKRK